MRWGLGMGVAVLLGCESPPVSTATVRTVSGPTQFAARSAGLFLIPTQFNGTPVTQMIILFHELDQACQASGAPVWRSLSVGATRIPPHVFGPGKHRSGPTDGLASVEWLGGDYQEVRTDCGLVLHVTDARLWLSSFEVGSAAGTVETRLDDGTEIAGEFTAVACPTQPVVVPGANEALPTCGLQ
jgi:hypothetical protein